MITTIETVAVCQVDDVSAMAQASGSSITLIRDKEIRDKEKKDSFGNNTTLFLSLDQGKKAVLALDRAIKEYESTPKRELIE